MVVTANKVRERIGQIAQKQILVLDGAMGSMIPVFKGGALTEEDFRGEHFKDHPQSLKGYGDLLCLTMPELISAIHEAYLKAGSDIIETCSFNANSISLGDYGLADRAYEISVAAARLARKTADSFSTADKPRFVAGSMGPTSKSASIPPDICDPGKRAAAWDDFETAYYENARGLLDGGADIIIIETIFDTLNARAAIFAVKRLEEERGIDVPLVVSATVSGEGGRLLTGQTAEAFCVSVLHANPLALGLNCSFGAEKLKPHIAAISAAVPCLVSAYPNAGLPNHTGAYDESPESMANHVEEYLREGLVNIVGGCCGSTPAHIFAIAERAKKYAPRTPPVIPKKTVLAGLEVLEPKGDCLHADERIEAALNCEFVRLIAEEKYEDAADIVRDMTEGKKAIVDVCVDSVPSDAKAAMTCFLNFALQYPDLARLPFMISSSRWDVIEAGLKCLQGKGLASLKEGETEYSRQEKLIRAYGAMPAVKKSDGLVVLG